MRISANSDDAGYTRTMPGVVILCNGKALSHVITADDETGYILRLQHQDGQFVLNDDKTDVLTEELHGRVEIIMPLAHG